MSLVSRYSLYPALLNLLLPRMAPFILAETVRAAWFSRWDAAIGLDAARLRPAIDAYLAAHPEAVTAEEMLKLRSFVQAVEGAAGVLPRFEAGKWYCLGLSYTFPSASSPGLLELRLGNAAFLRLEGLSVLGDGAVIDVLLQTMLAGKVVVTDAKTSWLDDLKASTEPVSCP